MIHAIGIAHGGAIREDGYPEPHVVSRLLKLKELLKSGEIEIGITTGGIESKPMKDYCVEALKIPQDRIYTEDRSQSTIQSMYYVRKIVGEWIKKGDVGENVFLHYITQYWALERTRFDADWIFPMYSHEVYGVEDSRPSKIILEEASMEKRNLEIDKNASKIYLLSKYRPDIAQMISFAVKEPKSIISEYRKRI
jgi:hypothetical protein